MPYSNPITTQEQQDLARYNPLHPRDGSANELYMPPAYFLVPPATQAGPVRWRLFDAAYISTGIIDPNRLGTGAIGTGNLYLADDGTWKSVATAGGNLPPGGSTGQILAKINNTDYNVEWIDNYAQWTSTVKHEVKAGEVLLRGQAVYVSSSDGTNMIVTKASNASEMTSSKTMGLIAQDLALNGKGFVITEGLLTGLDTSMATLGDLVWLGTNGNLLYGLANKPVAPAHMVFLGVVTRVNNNNGEIFVKVQNGFELNEIHDVLISAPSTGQLLRRDSDGLWKNWTPNFLTSVPTLDQVTSAGNTTMNSITVGGLTVNGITNIVGASSTTSPILTVTNTSSGNFTFMVNNTGTGNANFGFQINSVNKATIGYHRTGDYLGFFHQGATPNYFLLQLNNDGSFQHNRTSDGNPDFKIFSSGNVLIQNGGTFTDAGYKLDVNGTMRSVGLITAPAGINTAGGAIQVGQGTSSGVFYDASNRIYNNTAYGWVTYGWLYNHLAATNGLLISNSPSLTKGSNSFLSVVGSVTATSALARGVYFNNTLVAAANNDVLVGLDIDPTFTNGAFTGVTNYGLRVGGSTGLLYDNTNKRLGIGVSAPTFDLDIQTATTDTDLLRVINPGGSASVNRGAGIIVTMLNTQVTGGRTRIRQFDTSGYGGSNFIEFVGGTGALTTEGSTYIQGLYEVGLGTGGTKRLSVGTAGVAVTGTFSNTTGVQLATSSGNVLIGTTTDAGFKLDVNGTARIQGDLSTSAGKNMLFGTTLPSRHTNSAAYPAIFVGNSNSSIMPETGTGYKGISMMANIVRDISSSWVHQDTTQPGWIMGLNYETANTDMFAIYRSAATAGTANFVRLFTINGAGNVLIGTTTDAGFKLDVNGTGRFSGNVTVTGSATNSLTVRGSGFTGSTNAFTVLNSLGNSLFTVSDVGGITATQSDFTTNTVVALGLQARVNQNLTISAPWADSTNVTIEVIANKAQVLVVRPNATLTLTSGTHDTQRITHTFAPTSGTAVVNALTLNQTINQTGGASGISRGLYVNPTITAAADFRAIETTVGKVIHQGLTNATQTNQVYYNTTTGELTYGALPTPATPTLAQVTTAGNTTTNSISVGAITSSGAIRSTLDTTGNALELFGAFSYYSGVQIGGVGLDKSPYINLFANGGATTSINFTRQNTPGVTFKIMHSYSQGIAQTPSFLGIGVDGTSIRILGDTGNVLINQGTDAGFKLDVNGGTRIKGTGTTSTTTSFLVQDSTNTNILQLRDNGSLLLRGPSAGNYTLGVRELPDGAIQIMTDFNIIGMTIYSSAIERMSRIISRRLGGAGVLVIDTNFGTADASAMFEIRSTSFGFLQPRMINAQAVAIATPATGLQVYDITNNKNLLYNGTAWQNIATESWVTAQGYLTSAPIPTLAQVTAAGNTTTANITVSTHITIKANSDSVYSVGNNNFNNISLAANTFGFGRNILSVATSTSETVALGDSALNESAFSYRNIAIGTGAGRKTQKTAGNLTVGGSNVFVGVDAGAKVDLGYSNTFLGDAAGSTMDVLETVAVGAFAGGGSGISTLTQGYSVYLGFRAGGSSTAGDNVFIGYDAGLNSTKSNWFILGNRNNAGLIEGNFSTGNVLIGSSTDNGTNKLQVNGSISATGGTSTNWNTAFSWGNHASAGYLTSFTETDPTVPSHVKAITTTNISNWNTAYSWGNHATAGYLTSVSDVWVNTTGDTMTGQLVISTSGTAGNPTLRVNSSNSGDYVHSQENIAANLTSGQRNILVIGQAPSLKNSGYFGYYWAGAGSDSNFITMGHWGNNDLFRIYGNGNVLINTTVDAGYKLDVNGSFRATSNSYLATNANTLVGIGVTTAFAKLHVQGADGLLLLQGNGAAGQFFPTQLIRGGYPRFVLQSEDGAVTFGGLYTTQDKTGNPWGNLVISSRTAMLFLIESYSGSTPVFSFDGSNTYVANQLNVATNLVVTSNFTVDTNTFFVNATTNRVGIGTTSPSVLLQAGAKVIDDNNYAYTSGAAMFVNQTQTSASVLNDPQEVLILARQGTAGQAFGAAAVFELSRFENFGTSSRTRLDIKLADGFFLPNSTRVMTMLSNGNIGIGTSAPETPLHVVGGTRITGTFPYVNLRGAYPNISFQSDDGSMTYGTITTVQAYGTNPFGNLVIQSRTALYFYVNTFSDTIPALSLLGGNVQVGLNIDYGYKFDVNGTLRSVNSAYFATTSGSVGIGTTSAVAKLNIVGGSANWNETTPGQTPGTIHLDPGVSTDNFGNAITFGASDYSDGDNAQAGIYVRSDGSYGTKMYFATTDLYTTGSKTRMVIDNSGNIGINTASPAYNFDIRRTNLQVHLSSLAENQNVSLFFNTAYDSSTLPRTAIIAAAVGSWSRSALYFCLNNATSGNPGVGVADVKMIITPGGNVGIGTTNPDALLTVSADKFGTLGGAISVVNSSEGSGSVSGIYMGSYARKTAIFYNWTANYGRGELIFATNNVADGSNAWVTDGKMHIKANGNVTIGTSTDSGFKLDVNGNTIIRGNLSMTDASNRYIYGINGNYINLYNGGTGGVEIYGLNGTAENKIYGGLRVTGNLITQGSFTMNGSLDIGSNNSVYAGTNGIVYYRGFDASMQFFLGHPTVGDFLWDYPAGTTLMTLKRGGNLLIGTTTDSGYKLNVNGSFRSNGDSYVASANGRVFGFDGLSAGQTLHFQYGGDSNHRISTTHGSAAQMDAYHGLIIRTSPASGGKALIVNQRNSAHFIQEWQENGTQKAYINSQGNLYLAQLDAEADGPVISTSGLLSSVAGYSGTVTIQQPAPLPPINIDVQNGIIVNVF